jgi:hypothetical protein
MTTSTFRTAWATALYGPGGFYRHQRPAAHFRTSVHASPLFATAVARLARELGTGIITMSGRVRANSVRPSSPGIPG